MTMTETLTMITFMLAPAFFSLLSLAALGSPIVAFLGEIAARTKSRIFYDKYGQQTTAMGLILLIILLLVKTVALGVVYTKYPEIIEQLIGPDSPMIFAFTTFAIFIVLGIPYMALWKKMRNTKGLHIFLGAGTSLAAIALVSLGVPAKLMITLPSDIAQEQVALGIRSMIMPMAIMYTILLIAAAGGLSCAYLVLRRKKEDFGRDYYNFTLKLAARWAAIPMFAFLVCQGWLFVVLPKNLTLLVTQTPLAAVWAAGVGIGLLCSIFWILISRSDAPLRMKGLIFLCVFLMWLMHTANATLFVNFMSMM